MNNLQTHCIEQQSNHTEEPNLGKDKAQEKKNNHKSESIFFLFHFLTNLLWWGGLKMTRPALQIPDGDHSCSLCPGKSAGGF